MRVSEIIRRGTLAARPAATAVAAGTLYFDTTNSILYRSTSSAWESVEGTGSFDGTMAEIATPSAPASGNARIYPKADGRFYSIDDAGTEYGPFSAAGGGGAGIPSGQVRLGQGNGITSITLNIAPADNSFVIVGLTLATGSGGATLSSTNTTWTKVRSAALSSVDNELWVGAVGTGGGNVITITHSYSFCSGTAIEVGSPMDPASLGVGLSSTTITNTLSSVTAGNVVLVMCCNSNTTVATTVTALDPRGLGFYGVSPLAGSGVGAVTLIAVSADDTDVAVTASGGNVLLMQELNLP